MRAMVLAAGVGSRLEPLTNQVPKPMVPVANRPVMQHILSLLKKHGFNDVISNLHYQPEKIKEYFGDGSKFGMNLEFSYERELTGDAGGVRTCKSFLKDSTFIVLMGDLLTDADLTMVIEQHKAKKALATIALKQVDDVRHFGVALTDTQGFITGFQEKPQPSEALSNYASTGIYVLEPAVFDYIPATGSFGFGRQLFPQLVEAGLPVLGVPIDDYYWSDVGTINQYRSSNCDALEGRVRIDMPGDATKFGFAESGAEVASNVRIDGRLLIGKNSRIAQGVTISGAVLIGDNCQIEEGAVLENSIVWSNSRVGRSSVLRDSVIGSGCALADGSSHTEVASVTSVVATK